MHHSDQPFQPSDAASRAEIERQIRALGLGPTGQFPGGKLNKADDGEIRISVGLESNKVIIAFGKSICWIGFDATQAKELAASLVKFADSIAPPAPTPE